MNITICISSYGTDEWRDLALERALPSTVSQNAEVIVEHQPDGNIATSRNRAAEQANGDWLCFLDADDQLAAGFTFAIHRIWKRHQDLPHPVLLTPAVQQISKGRKRNPRFYPEGSLEKNNWLVIGTVLPTSLFHQVGGFPDYPHGFEDYALWSKCWRIGAQVIKVKQAVYVQHINPDSKHRVGWRDRQWQVETHERVTRELDEWEAAYAANLGQGTT